jgi:hypothetical protein
MLLAIQNISFWVHYIIISTVIKIEQGWEYTYSDNDSNKQRMMQSLNY